MPHTRTHAKGTAEGRPLHHDIVPFVTHVLACTSDGEFALRAEPTPTADDVRAALASALGHRIYGRVAMHSVSRELRGPENAPLVVTLGDALSSRFDRKLRASLKKKRYATLRRHFGLDETVVSSVGTRPLAPAMDAVRATLYHAYGAVFAGDGTAVEALKPLLTLLTRAIPVGTTSRRNGASDWLVVIA